MASTIASHIDLGDRSSLGGLVISKELNSVEKTVGILCHICNSIFENRKNYDTHYAGHDTAGRVIIYSCVKCKKKLSSYRTFRDHYQALHEKLQCKHCYKYFKKLHILNSHISDEHEWKCTQCDKIYTSKEDLKIHMNVSHGTIENGNSGSLDDLKIPEGSQNFMGILCYICNITIEQKKDYDTHYAEHNTGGMVIYACIECKKQFSRHGSLLRHLAGKKINKYTQENNMKSMESSVINVGDINSPSVLVLKQKITAVDKTGGIFCHICNKTFIGNKKNYDTHYAGHNTRGTIIYTCVECKKHFSVYPSFRGHCYLNHVVKDKFKCRHCSTNFPKLSILNSHISAVHECKCTQCNEICTSKKDLEIHKKICHEAIIKGKNAPPYYCTPCSTVIRSVEECKNHIDSHCKMLYPCPICKKVQPNKLAATNHLTKHFDENLPSNLSMPPSNGEDSSIHILGGILCWHCDEIFHKRADIDEHFAEAHGDKTVMYSCNVCSKSFEKYTMFGDHCYRHCTKEKFLCDQCNKTFPRLSLLVIHTEMFHIASLEGEKPYLCKECGRGFRTNRRLQEHQRIVHGDEECLHTCSKPGCNAAFGKPKDLVHHMKVHSPMLENWCKQCGLQFATLSSAEKHLDVHRCKEYSCPICVRTYGEKYLLVKHVPVHFEAVMHVCKICGQVYSARNRLIEHTKTHSETRTYPCTFCDKSFVRPYKLSQHLNTHTGVRPYKCTVCPKRFTNYPNLYKHLTRMHAMNKVEIKRIKAEMTAGPAHTALIKTSPSRAESGIESGGSEVSDIYAFPDSDDNADVTERENLKSFNVYDNVVMREIHSVVDPLTGEKMSMSDTVNAAIDRIDSLGHNLDVMNTTTENETNYLNTQVPEIDDESDIKAIVEHIEAMSGELEAMSGGELEATSRAIDDETELAVIQPDFLQYADLMPDDSFMFDSITELMQATVPDISF